MVEAVTMDNDFMQGLNSRNDLKTKILQQLVSGTPRNWSSITNLVKKSSNYKNNKTINKYLQELVKEKLVKKEPGPAEKGFKPIYRITEKGNTFATNNIRQEISWMLSDWITNLTPENLNALEKNYGIKITYEQDLPVNFQESSDKFTRLIIYAKESTR